MASEYNIIHSQPDGLVELKESDSFMKEVKHFFMTYRNGIISDTLRKAGDPHKVIFGLQLPQIAEISRNFPNKRSFAIRLWQDREVRESRLLACRIFPPEEMDPAIALEWTSDCRTREEADILSFFLLRKLPFASDLLVQLKEKKSLPEEVSYIAEALERNLI